MTIIDNSAGGVWSTGSYSSDNGTSTWKGSWTSTSTDPQITITSYNAVSSNANNTYLLQNSTGYIGSSSNKNGTFAISISSGYRITGYEIIFENVNTDGSHNQTITPNGGDAAIAEGTESATASISNLNTRSTKFVLTGENTLAKVTKFTITYTTAADAGGGTWSSGVASTEVGGSGNYYSNCWYLKLTTPDVDDVFFDEFELSFASDGSADDDIDSYLAFTYDKFTGQYNHAANEFIAISDNSISGNSSSTANTVTFTFTDMVRMNGNVPVYVCFVSKNPDGTYNLQKKGIAVKNTTSDGNMYFCNGSSYTTTESNSSSNYQCHYTCSYTSTYDYAQTSGDYHLWSGINYADRTSGGAISISYMKYTAPGTSGQYVHFDQLSLSMRNSDVVANTYLLLSTECLTGSGVSTSTEFDASRFTAISTNKIPTANYGKVFTFAFDSDSYLDGGATYYVYMGTKTDGGKFCLQKYGIYINHTMITKTGFAYSSALTTSSATTNNAWQAIYYSSKCTFADQKVTVNIQEAGTTIRTKTLYTNEDITLETALNIPSVFTVTPSSISHSAGSSTQDVTIAAPFSPSTTPATETSKVYFVKLNGYYAGGSDGKTLSSTTDMSVNDRWTMGGNYYDGYTFYNLGQEKYLSVSNSDNSQGTFVEEASAAKFIAGTNSTGFGFRLLGSRFCYLNDYGNNNVLSTWKNASAATAEGSRVVIEDPLVSLYTDFDTLYNDIYIYTGTAVGKYHHDSYTQDGIDEELSAAETAYTDKNANDFIESFLTLSEIRYGWEINEVPTEKFYRFRNGDNYMCNVANGNVRTVTDDDSDASTIFYLDENSYLIAYADGYGFNYGYCKAVSPGIFNSFDFSESSTLGKYLIHANAGTGDAKYSDRYITVDGESLAQGQGKWRISEVTDIPVTFKAAGLGYATFCSPVDVKIPAGVSAYVSKINWETNKISLFSIENTTDDDGDVVIPANTAVMLYKDGLEIDTDVDFEISSNYSGEEITGNGFYGTTAAEAMTDGNTYYSLRAWKADGADTPSKVGFTAKTSGETLAGFKGWICHEEEESARNFTIVFGGDSNPTGIVEALGLEDANVEIYDLNGRKLSEYKKGINIVNGKKVMVK